MYQTLPNLVLGFHGCSRDTYEKILYKHEELDSSKNDYDWLGHGIYFWEKSYDSVRGIFIEGGAVYPSSGILEKTHIQICVRNPNCIKGYFAPKEFNGDFARI